MGENPTPQNAYPPAALMSLQEALTNAYWYKQDLRAFLLHALGDRSLVPLLDWRDRKRSIVTTLVCTLARGHAPHQEQLQQLMQAVSAIDDFTHLERLDGGEDKARLARESIAALQRALRQFAGMKAAGRAPAGERRQTPQIRSGVSERLASMREGFLQALKEVNPDRQGDRFERLLTDVFTLFDIEGGAFRRTEQTIEGKLALEGTECIFEGRWIRQATFECMLAFGDKLWRAPEQSAGIFLSVQGFSPAATQGLWDSRRPLVLIGGADLVAVLEELIDLPRLLRCKMRHFIDTGDIDLPIAKILTRP